MPKDEASLSPESSDGLLRALPLLPLRVETEEEAERAAGTVREALDATAVVLTLPGGRPPEEAAPSGGTVRVFPVGAGEAAASLRVTWNGRTAEAGSPLDIHRREMAVALAEALAPRVALGVAERHTRDLQEQLARQDFSLYAVYQISKTLGGVLTLEEVLGHVTDMMAEVMTVRGCYVLLPGEDQEVLVVRSWRTPMREGPPPVLELREAEAVPEWLEHLSWESQPVQDFDSDMFARAFPQAAVALRTAAVRLLVPLVYKKRLVGMLALEEKYTGSEFTQRDCQFLSVLGPLAANAISNAQLYELAILDGLTRLYVVRYFRQRCREEIKRAYRYGKSVSLVLWDLDHFKRVNDTHGHLVGDQLLRELGRLMKSATRVDVDIVARYGGEEFVMLLPETPREGAAVLAERVRQCIEERAFTSLGLQITISGGVAAFPQDARDYASLVARADDELFRAKRLGRNRVCLPEPLSPPVEVPRDSMAHVLDDGPSSVSKPSF